MPVNRRLLQSLALALLLLASLASRPAVAETGAPWLLRVECDDEATFRRLVASGARVLLWWDEKAYILADPAQRDLLTAEGLRLDLLTNRPSEGDYHVIWAFEREAEALRWRYGTLVALGDGFYLLGVPLGQQLGADGGPRYAQRLPFTMAAPRAPAPALLNPPVPPPRMDRIVGAVSEERVVECIAALQDDDSAPGEDALRSRYVLSAGLDAEAAYISGELRAMGLAVTPFHTTAIDYSHGSRLVSNIIAVKPGLLPESEGMLIVCAHYDSTAAASPGWNGQWASMPAPGADDNGSGVAAALEVARVLAPHTLAYTIRFCFFVGEEQGLYGSQAYAEELHAAGANVLGVINLDMIGYDGNGDGVLEVHTGTTIASQVLGKVLVRNMQRYAPSLRPAVFARRAIWASDHAPFWRLGYPALQIIEDRTWDFNPRYHTSRDVLAVLDTGYCTDITRAVVGTVGELAQLRVPDLQLSRHEATFDGLSGSASYTITLHNSGQYTANAALKDVLPPQLVALWPPVASQGEVVWDEALHGLRWSGAIAPQGTVTIAFRALADPALPPGTPIANTAVVDDGAGEVLPLQAVVHVVRQLVLPIILKGP
ncbi:MAG: M28 family metallopeptidase [Anaerolineae bacterium]|nr:M28 family metallopeptidase [Anaerolineae bacterium]